MRWFTIKETCEQLKLSPSVLRIWDMRYGWPVPVRQSNGYRLYSEAMIDEVREFNAAGRPFHQIEAGVWQRPVAPAKPIDPSFVGTFADLEDQLLTALQSGADGTVARYLASLGRMRPDERQRYVECIRAADAELGGRYAALMARYGIAPAQEATR